MKRPLLFFLLVCLPAILGAQTIIKITGGEKPSIAVPDFRAAGDAQRFMSTFNTTLWSELQNSGQLKLLPKTLYPLRIPQQPGDFRAPAGGRSQGPWLTDWSGPPVNGDYLAFGYAANQNNQLALFGWLYNVKQPDPSSAQLIGKVYLGSLDDEGAKKVAREFAADILKQFGAASLAGTKIYFVSDRTGHKEIWSMDYDGSNQKQFTSYRSISIMPSLSPDGTKIAFTSYAHGNPAILIHSLETGRRLPFYNQKASMNAQPDFTPDGRHIVFSSTASGYAQIYMTDLDGSNLRRLSNVRAIEVEPKVNPKTGADMVFVSGRGGPQQIYKMNLEGTDVVRLSSGEGQASNPSWNPDGQHIAFAWTRGYDPGTFNIFVMDVANRQFEQLTHGQGRNENPSWAPDGVHLVYTQRHGRSSEIWTMLANGTEKRQLTTQGNNYTPVWSRVAR